MAEKYQVLKKDNFINLMKDTTEYRIEGKGKWQLQQNIPWTHLHAILEHKKRVKRKFWNLS